MSSDLETRFTAAAEAATRLPKRPDNETMLQLYALDRKSVV